MDYKFLMCMDRKDKIRIAKAAKREGLKTAPYIRSVILRNLNNEKSASMWKKHQMPIQEK